MTSTYFFLFFSFLFIAGCSHQSAIYIPKGKIERVSKSEDFQWPYFYYVPKRLKPNKRYRILVLPNNTGNWKKNDLSEHEENAFKKTKWASKAIAEKLDLILLRPVFPRWKKEWWYYTHALDRDTLLTRRPDIERIDLQLISMINDLKSKLKKSHIRFHEQIIITGFSASGMFANRFSILHPELVKASAVGSPGGWPIAPISHFKDYRLRYPVGVEDLFDITNKSFNKKAFKEVDFFFYLGDKDSNDSVPYGDGYDSEDKETVFKLFGKTPVDRWPIIEKIYNDAGCNCTFKLYRGVGHTINDKMLDDFLRFLSRYN